MEAMFLFKKKSKLKKVTEAGKTRRIDSGGRRLSYQVGNLQKLGSRSTQEDSFAIVNALDVNEITRNGMLAIVADGMGGMKDGKLVSEAAVDGFVRAFHNLDREDDIAKQLYNSVHQVNDNLHDKFCGVGGTTVVMVMIYNAKAYWVSVGDSTIYLKRNSGLFKLNKDHTYHNELYLEELYKDEIDKEQVESNEDKARLSEFLGNSRIGEIDYNLRPLKLEKDDVIFLCSDGISSFIDEKSISASLEFPPTIACEQLNNLIIQKSNKRQDNYTGLVISCME